MITSTSKTEPARASTTDVLIPLIRAAATVGFVIAPYSLGFVIIAVSEQLIRSIMVGEHPEMLVSELQKQFPNASIEIAENYDAGLVAKVVQSLEKTPAGNAANFSFLEFMSRHRPHAAQLQPGAPA